MIVQYIFLLMSICFVRGDFKRRTFDLPETKIVGGMEAPEGGIPYQASLRDINFSHFCGATLIDKRWVLTAAHCLEGDAPELVTVVVGTNRLMSGGQRYSVDRTIVHEDYNTTVITNDIALVRISEDIEFDDKTQPIDLPTSDTQGGASVLLSGWGREKEGNNEPVPDTMQVLNQTVINQDICVEAYKNINVVVSSEICTINIGKQGACQGDSGGPLVENNQIVGIVSWGLHCAEYYPDVATRVYSFVDWIKEKMQSNTDDD